MATVSCSSLSLSGLKGQSVLIGQDVFWLALILLASVCSTPAIASVGTLTSLSIASSGNAVTEVPVKTVVTLTATVTAGSTPVTHGRVNFCDASAAHCTDIHLLATAQLTKDGTAVLKFVPGIGSHSYKAVFLGTTNDATSSSSPSALAVTGRYQTFTEIQPSGSIGNYTLTATVTGVGVPVAPTGTISFLDTSDANSVVGTMELAKSAEDLYYSDNPINVNGNAPSTVVVADFNGDGLLDVAVGISNSLPGPPVRLLFGAGDGTFPTRSYTGNKNVNYGQTLVAVGDFNGDGIPDLAIAASNVKTVAIELGNGDGTFREAANPVTVDNAGAIAVGDYNGDGNADLAVTTNNGLTILLGNGDGTFPLTANTTTGGAYFRYLVTGDFNGDGNADLAASNESNNTVTILLGNGEGIFTAAASPATGPEPSSLAVGDFDGDGNADLAVATGNNTVTVLLGTGDGTFTASVKGSATGSAPTSVAVGDFNGDGKADLAVANPYDNTATILLGNGDGTFTKAARTPPAGDHPVAIAVGDFDGDGAPDLVAADDAIPVGGYSFAVTLMLAEFDVRSTATISGISLPPNISTQQVEASYPGDSNYSPSASGTVPLETAQLLFSTNALSFGTEQVGYSTKSETVYLTNASDFAIAISSIKLAGGDASSFVTSNTCGQRLAARASCKIGVRFAPAELTSSGTDTIVVTDSTADSPQIITLTGAVSAFYPASLSLSATSLSFGSQPVGGSTQTQTVFVVNTSVYSLYFRGIALTGANASSFVTSNSCGSSVAPFATCTIGVRFVPRAVGAATASIALIDNTTGSPQTILLSGTGATTEAASVSLSASNLSFGGEAVNISTGPQNVTITNTSGVTLYFDKIALSGASVTSFITSNTCGATLAPGAFCKIGVRFIPTETGAASASITVTGTAGNLPQTITLSGTGLPDVGPTLSISTTSLTFGLVPVGLSAYKTVVLTNVGSALVSFTGLAVEGKDAASFSVHASNTEYPFEDCGQLNPGASCTVTVTVTPQSTGPRALSAKLVLTDNAPTSPQVISLTETGIGPLVSFDNSALSFPGIQVGSSASDTVTVTNIGNAPLSITGFTGGGYPFMLSESCGASLAVGASCLLKVTYYPGSTEDDVGTLSMFDNAFDSPQGVSLFGNGTCSYAPDCEP